MASVEVGELLYEYTVNLTGMTEYGVSFQGLMSGAGAPPAEGARFDAWFEGRATGPRIRGAVKGVDYLRVRADGRFELHIHAEIATDDGHRVSLEAGGVCLPTAGSQVAGLRESVTLFSSAKEYAWVNGIQVWATGTVDLGEGVVRIRGYSA